MTGKWLRQWLWNHVFNFGRTEKQGSYQKSGILHTIVPYLLGPMFWYEDLMVDNKAQAQSIWFQHSQLSIDASPGHHYINIHWLLLDLSLYLMLYKLIKFRAMLTFCAIVTFRKRPNSKFMIVIHAWSGSNEDALSLWSSAQSYLQYC